MFQQKLFWLVFWKTKDLYLIIMQKLIILKSSGFHVDFMWNLADFMKSWSQPPPCIHQTWEIFAETLAFIILGGFHRWYLGEIHQISGWNPPTLHSSNWRVFAETLAFIILGGFHRWYLGEICQISWVKSTRFQGEFHEILGHSPYPAFIKLKSFAKTLAFIILVDFTGDIWWNPPDFRVKSGGFQGWNPPPCIHQTEEFLLKHLLL